jgi:biopolymer transport protein ExbD
MKKYSKTAHHSLNELNITPLLDLAFVLLVIFIITTTPMVNDLDMNLPSASARPKDAPKKPNYVSVDKNGDIFLNMKKVDLIELQQLMVDKRNENPDLSVVVRGDSAVAYQRVINVLDILQQANVTKVGLATEPNKN